MSPVAFRRQSRGRRSPNDFFKERKADSSVDSLSSEETSLTRFSSGEAVDLVSEVDLGESVYRVYFEAVDSVSEAAASRPYSLLSRLLLN